MKIVYFSSPSFGNINPSLEVIKHLIHLGHNVVYYSTYNYEYLIKSTGAKFKNYPKGSWDNIYGGDIRNNYSFLKYLHLQAENILLTNQDLYCSLLKEVKLLHPNAIIHDSYAYWGKNLSRELSVPAVSFVTNYVLPKEAYLLNQQIFSKYVFDLEKKRFKSIKREIILIEKLLKKKHNLEKIDLFDFMLNRESLNIIFSIENIQKFAPYLNDSFYFAGASIPENINLQDEFFDILSKKKPIIYISLGTVLNNNTKFFTICLEVAKELCDFYFIISIGQKININKLDKLHNVFIGNNLPQCKILKYAKMFFTHAGHNSVNEALFFGVPMLLYPLGNEQFIISKVIEELNLGLCYKETDISKFTIIQYVFRLINNNSILNSIELYKYIYNKKSNPQRVANYISNYLMKNGEN